MIIACPNCHSAIVGPNRLVPTPITCPRCDTKYIVTVVKVEGTGRPRK
jgi:DNA-directed RNA polymerase subunit RPC12/RpoP